MTFLVTIDAAASCHPEPSRFSVILNAAAFVILNRAAGGVKDLEHLIGSPL